MTFIEKKIVLVVSMKIKDQTEEKVGEIFKGLALASKNEEGCIEYRLHRSSEDEKLFLLYEEWESQEALDKHRQMVHFKDFHEKSDKFLAVAPEVSTWEIVY